MHNLRFPYRDSVDNIRYYGGPFIADWNDPVRQKAVFLNPSSFNKKYNYRLETMVQHNFGKDTAYVIQFKSTDKEQTLQGRFWIDKETSSYMKIEWSNNNPQNLNPLVPSRKITKNYLTIYQKLGNISLVNYTSLKTKIYNSKTRKESNSVLEFITTDCNLMGHLEPIPFKKRLQYGVPISEMENYGNTDFEGDYQKIKSDSLSFYKSDSSIIYNNVKSIGENLERVNSRVNFRAKIFRFTKNITTSYALTGALYKSRGVDNFYLNYVNQKNQDPREVPGRFIPGTLLGIGYKLAPLSHVSISFLYALSKANLYKLTSIKYQRFFLIKKIGNPLFLTASVGITAGKTGFSLGKLSSEIDIVLDDESLKRDTRIYLGNKLTSAQTGIGFEYRKRKISYFAEIQYMGTIREKDILQFKSKGNFFKSKIIVRHYPIKEIAVNPVNLYRSISPVTMSTGLRLGF
ncbi:hypothetical protein [Dyadobacter sp. CY356]|uniref:hypothetical protein n=1 Tax=Dyadobacter sp. CY356 TaxID=2906442 RepID=UPI001F3575EA|nr:hypothetical protein [Dyadobacter sp. CY356]